MKLNYIYQGNCLEVLKTFEDNCINCCITSPPYYGLRDYGVDGQIGNEDTPEDYVNNLVEIFDEVKRVLREDGVLWLNLGDSWSNKRIGEIKQKDLIGIPWMVAFALRESGWYLRQDIIWAKGNPMPESVKDRCTKSHEYIFLLSKNKKYYYDYRAIKEPCISKSPAGNKNCLNAGRITEEGWSYDPQKSIPKDGKNKRDVWSVNTKPCKETHFATYPDTLIEPCILAGCPKGGIVLDPFMGAGTTGMVAKKYSRNYVGIELNAEYIDIANKRIDECVKK